MNTPLHMTTYALNPILLQQLWEVKGALSTIFVGEPWKQILLDPAIEVRHMILDAHFWVDVNLLFVELECDMLDYAGTNSPCLSEIYESVASMCERNKSIIDKKDTTLNLALENFIHNQWNN